MRKYIHYGHKNFNLDCFKEIKNSTVYRNKPLGGLWASAVDSKYGWKEWNDDNEFRVLDPENSFTFVLKDGARILILDSINAVKAMPMQKVDELARIAYGHCPDFEKLKEQYDAIEYLLSNDYRLYMALYGWDCDSILILNPNVVKQEINS